MKIKLLTLFVVMGLDPQRVWRLEALNPLRAAKEVGRSLPDPARKNPPR
jgi:hypothetical protein